MFGNVVQTFDPIVCSTNFFVFQHNKAKSVARNPNVREIQCSVDAIIVPSSVDYDITGDTPQDPRITFLDKVNAIVVITAPFEVVTGIVTGNVWKCCSNF